MSKLFGAAPQRALAFFLVLGLAPGALAAASNPYDKYRNTSYSNKGLASEQDEIRLGAQVHEQILQKYRLVDDPEIAEYVNDLGQRIAARSERPNLQYNFFVVDDPSVNAFSLPGGFIYVNTGLLRLVESEDELAATIGHEIGHVVARHGLRNLKSAQKAQLGVGIASILGAVLTGNGSGGRAIGGVAQIFAAGKLTQFSREFEREADYLGLHDMTDAGFEPNGMVGIFEKLGRNQSASKSKIGGIFADHPDSAERMRNTQAEIEEHLANARRGRQSAGRGDMTRARFADDSAFDAMKRALNGSYRRGRTDGRYPQQDRQVLRRRPAGQNGGSYDPYDQNGQYDPQQEPNVGPFDPPPLRRQPPTRP